MCFKIWTFCEIFDICVIMCILKETHKILSHVFSVNIILLLIQPHCIVQTLSALKATPVQILLVTPYRTHAHHTELKLSSIARFLRFSYNQCNVHSIANIDDIEASATTWLTVQNKMCVWHWLQSQCDWIQPANTQQHTTVHTTSIAPALILHKSLAFICHTVRTLNP